MPLSDGERANLAGPRPGDVKPTGPAQNRRVYSCLGCEMSKAAAGPHHCIGTGYLVSEIVFRRLHTLCVSNGGTLSLAELESFRSKFLNGFSSGFELFEKVHQHCMDASACSVETPFSRDKILATLLRKVGEQSASHAFALQTTQLGQAWTHRFFESFAGYVRQHICKDADRRLINVYADAATLPKMQLSTDVLLKLDAVSCILRECIEAFAPPEPRVGLVCDYVNRTSARQEGIGGAHIMKVTEDQVRTFLRLLPQELMIRAGARPPFQPSRAP